MCSRPTRGWRRELVAADGRALADAGDDDLAVDDRAFAVVPPMPRRRVLRVGASDLYLDGALLSLGRTITVDRTTLAAAERDRARWADYDLVIFDGVAPAPRCRPRGATCTWTRTAPATRSASAARCASRCWRTMRRDHALLRQLDLGDVNIAEARRLVLAAGDVAVAGSFGVPLIVARDRPGLRIAATSFSPRRSDMPMRPAFPLFVANALAWTGTKAEMHDAPAAQTGATLRVRDDLPEIAIAHTGFYKVGDEVVAANLGDVRESDTTPARGAGAGRAHAGAAGSAGGGERHRAHRRPSRCGWRWRCCCSSGSATTAGGRREDLRLARPLTAIARWRSIARRGCWWPSWRRRCCSCWRGDRWPISRAGNWRCRRCCARLCVAGVAAALAGPDVTAPGARGLGRRAGRRVRQRLRRGAGCRRAAVTSLARAAAERGEPAPRVVRFAARAEELTGVDPVAGIARLPAPGGRAPPTSRSAVSFGAGLVDATAIPRLLLLSDGVATRGDVLAAAERLRDRGLPLFAAPLPPGPLGDVAVVELSAPDDVRPRVPFQVDVRAGRRSAGGRARAARGGDAHVSIDEPEQTVASRRRGDRRRRPRRRRSPSGSTRPGPARCGRGW